MGLFSNPARTFFSDEEGKRIVSAIQTAEKNTSGEIRVHLDPKLKKGLSAREQGVKAFARLGMDDTEQRNGVLIFLAVKDHKFSLIADHGIHAVVPEGFWDEIAAGMSEAFKQKDFAGGIVNGIQHIGEKLKEFFPYQSDDINELPDEISIG